MAESKVADQFDHKTVSANKVYRRCDAGKKRPPLRGSEGAARLKGERVSPLGSLGSDGVGLFSHQGVVALTGLHECLDKEQGEGARRRGSIRAGEGGR